MRQRDGSDLLGSGDPRSADIGILYVDPADTRQTILTAIATQDRSGRKQIAIVLPEQRKAFLQPVDFDGLKDMRRTLKAQLVFIAPPGPGPAAFARQRRFQVYSSLDSFKTELAADGAPSRQGGGGTRPGILNFGSRRGRSATPPRSRGRGSSALPPDRSPAQAQPSPVDRQQSDRLPPSDTISDVNTAELAQHDEPERAGGAIGAGAVGFVAGAGLGAVGAHEYEEHEGEDDEDALYAPPPDLGSGSSADEDAGGVPAGGVPPVGPPPLQEPEPTDQPMDGAVPGAIVFGSPSSYLPRTIARRPAAQGRTGSGKLVDPVPVTRKSGNLGSTTSTNRPGGTPGPIPVVASTVSSSRPFNPPPEVQRSPDIQSPPNDGQRRNASDNGAIVAAAVAGGLPGAEAVSATSARTGSATAGAASATTSVAPGNAPVVSSSPAGAPVTPGAGRNVNSSRGSVGAPPPIAPVLAPGRSPMNRPPRKRGRLLLFILLAVLLLFIIGSTVAALRQNNGISSLIQVTTKATVNITPASQLEQNRYLVTGILNGTPDPAKYQVQERTISSTSPSQSVTGDATGTNPATNAKGTLTFLNNNASGVTITARTLTGTSGVPVRFNESVFVPAASPSSAIVSAQAVDAGASGNIPALDIFSQSCCGTGITVKSSAFSGGANATFFVAGGDAKNIAHANKDQLMHSSSTVNALQQQVSANERVVDGSLSCGDPSVVSSSPGAGTAVSSLKNALTVHATITCSEKVYDNAALQTIAQQRLKASALLDSALQPSTSWSLAGAIVTNVISATFVSANQQTEINIEAKGLWVYQLSNSVQQQLKQGLVKLTKSAAQAYLLQQPGIQDPQITLSDNGNVMPDNANDITLVIHGLSGLQNTPTATGTGGANSTPSPGSGTGVPTLPPDKGGS